MAGTQLQIDDEYCEKMAQYFVDKGRVIEGFIQEYIDILNRIEETAIMKGDIADSLKDFIAYAKKLKGSINDISGNAQSQTKQFVSAIDSADKYLF